MSPQQAADPSLLLEHAVPGFEPATPTPPLNELPKLESPTPLPVIEVIDDGKLTVLNAWRRRDESP
jgi:hypothetical protein